MKKAFSLLEMIVVMVVSSIIIGVIIQIYNALYSNYLKSSAITKLESQAINTMLIIENYLQQSIKESISIKNGSQILPLNANANSNEFIWLSQSFENRQNQSSKFNWSGFIDITKVQVTPNSIILISPLSKFEFKSQNNIINNLKFNNSDIRIIFKGSDNIYQNSYKILDANGEQLTIERANKSVFISEVYYISHSAISLKLQDNTLYLNEFSPNNLNKPIRINALANNVKSFNIKQNGANIIFRLCFFDIDGVELCKSSSV